MKGEETDRNRGAVERASVSFVAGACRLPPRRAQHPRTPSTGHALSAPHPTPTPLLEGGVSPVGGPVRGGTRHIGPPVKLETGGGAAALGDSWPKMRQKHRDSPSRSAARLTEGSRAGPGSRERGRRCGRPCGCWGEMGAEARWERGGGGGQYRAAGSRARAGEAAAAPRGRPAPRRVICMLSRLRADTRARGSLARSLALGFCRRSAGADPESLRAGESPSWRGREGTREGGSEGAPRLSVGPAARPSCYPRSAPGPRSHTWETWDGAGAACGTSGWGGGAALAWRGGGGGGGRRGGGRGGSEPEGSAQSCLSSCFYSHPERRSQKGAEPTVAGF